MKRGVAQYPAMQAASVHGPQRAVSGLSPGKYLSFHKGSGSFPTAFDPFPSRGCEIRGHGPGIVRVVVVGVAVGVDKAEIVRVRRIDGPAPRIGRRQSTRRPATRHVFRDTPKWPVIYFLFRSLSRTARISSFSRSIFSPRLCDISSSFLVASAGGTLFPSGLVKHPCGFSARMV